METVRLPFNYRAHRDIRGLEARSEHASRLSDRFADEISKPPRAIYLGVYEDFNLIGCVRLVPEPLEVVLLDALEVQPDHPERSAVEQALLEAARALAAENGKGLSVIAYTQASQRWTELGFQPAAQAVLTLA